MQVATKSSCRESKSGVSDGTSDRLHAQLIGRLALSSASVETRLQDQESHHKCHRYRGSKTYDRQCYFGRRSPAGGGEPRSHGAPETRRADEPEPQAQPMASFVRAAQ
jgi:hypothetical protein